MKKHNYILSFALLVLFYGSSCNKENDSPEPITTDQTPTPVSTSITDIDGNIYNTVVIGTQTWLNKNLNVSRYRNGDVIPQVTDPTTWKNLSTGAWCYYNNDPANETTFGKLYNWYAVNDPRGLAPVGVHIPSEGEWIILRDYLGGSTVAGGKMKSIGIIQDGTGLWETPNTGATNISGFNGLPAGALCAFCPTNNFGIAGNLSAIWSSSTEYTPGSIVEIYLRYDDALFKSSTSSKNNGLSVRCVKN